MLDSPTQDTQPTYLTNQEALKQLEQQRNQLTNACYGIGFGSIAASLTNPLWLAGGISALAVSLTRLQKTSQIFFNMGRLIEAFESLEVQIIPRLAVPGHGSLDLLLKFPTPPKAVFAIAFRSQGKSKILYKEEKEALYLRRSNGGGLNRWTPDHIERLALQESWLKRNQMELFGLSAKDKRRPCIKLLVLTGETKIGSNLEHLYVTIGDQRVLLLRRRASIYVMEEHQLIPFIHGWFTQPKNG
jgi:hypothetical protein